MCFNIFPVFSLRGTKASGVAVVAAISREWERERGERNHACCERAKEQ